MGLSKSYLNVNMAEMPEFNPSFIPNILLTYFQQGNSQQARYSAAEEMMHSRPAIDSRE